MQRKTKIIATLGPASNSEHMIEKLIKAGVNVFRINLSHATTESIKTNIERVQKIREKMQKSISILVDTRGPEIRLKSFNGGSAYLKKGNHFVLTNLDVEGDENIAAISQDIVIEQSKTNKIILANDAKLQLKIIEKKPNQLICKVLTSGTLMNNKALSFKDQAFDLQYINEKDKADLKLALSMGIDYIAASFVNSVKDINDLKNFAAKFDENVKVISKIESSEGIKNIKDITLASDGIMIARGDLGVETDYEKLPHTQQLLIDNCVLYKRTSIVATEMLESMITNIRPTRAEISDVNRAVMGGGKVVMLSAESAVGHDPLKCIEVFNKILTYAESIFDYQQAFKKSNCGEKDNLISLVQSAVYASYYSNAKCIVTYTRNGNNAKLLSNTFCKCPIIAITKNKQTFNQLALLSNVTAVLDEFSEQDFSKTRQTLVKNKLVKNNDVVVVINNKNCYSLNIEKI